MKYRSLMTALLWAAAVVAAPAPATAGDEGMLWSASAGLGYDSNVYLTPDAPYNDLSQAGNPLIVPNKQSGLFVPLGLGADYSAPSGMAFSYRFDGEIYLNSALRNANTYDNNATLGWNMTLGGADFYAGLLAGYHKKIYYDRDTGEAKLSRVSGTNISNRYTHLDFGGEAKLRQKVGNVEYKLDTKLAMLFYNDPIVMAPLDHMLFELGGSGRFPLGSKSTKLKLGYDFAIRDYSNRSARNTQGVQSRANGLLTYYYHTVNAQLFQKLGRKFYAYLDYWHTWRIDGAVGYNSYSKDRVKLRLRYHLTRNFLLHGSVSYSRKNYPNAFAYDNPAAGKKTYNLTEASLKAEYDHLFSGFGDPSLWIKGDYVKQSSSDLRYAYNQTQAVIGADWQF